MTRRVRTPEGARKYGQPIGTVIRLDLSEPGTGRHAAAPKKPARTPRRPEARPVAAKKPAARRAPSAGAAPTRTPDGRAAQGQTRSTFRHPETGHPMGKTEVGDTYEHLFEAKGKDLLHARYGCCLKLSEGTRTTPLDFLVGGRGGEVKTLSAKAGSQKTAIKREEIARKVEACRVGNLEPLLVVQVVDQESGTVRMYSHEAFESRAVKRMEFLGEYTYDLTEFQAAQESAGHWAKRGERAARSEAKSIDDEREGEPQPGDLVIAGGDGAPVVYTVPELASAPETKVTRRVRTPEGARHYGLPVGSIIRLRPDPSFAPRPRAASEVDTAKRARDAWIAATDKKIEALAPVLRGEFNDRWRETHSSEAFRDISVGGQVVSDGYVVTKTTPGMPHILVDLQMVETLDRHVRLAAEVHGPDETDAIYAAAAMSAMTHRAMLAYNEISSALDSLMHGYSQLRIAVLRDDGGPRVEITSEDFRVYNDVDLTPEFKELARAAYVSFIAEQVVRTYGDGDESRAAQVWLDARSSELPAATYYGVPRVEVLDDWREDLAAFLPMLTFDLRMYDDKSQLAWQETQDLLSHATRNAQVRPTLFSRVARDEQYAGILARAREAATHVIRNGDRPLDVERLMSEHGLRRTDAVTEAAAYVDLAEAGREYVVAARGLQTLTSAGLLPDDRLVPAAGITNRDMGEMRSLWREIGAERDPDAPEYAQPEMQAKANVAARLSRRLAKNPAAVDAWNRARGGPYPDDDEPRLAMQMEVSSVISLWADTAGDHSSGSLATQRAIQEEFKLAANPFQRAVSEHEDVSEARRVHDDLARRTDLIYSRVGAWRRFVVRAMYEETQEALAERGIRHVTLLRGMSDVQFRPGVATIPSQPASSWAWTTDGASAFADDPRRRSTGWNVILAAVVPASRILGFPMTGFGCLAEDEFVVLDTPGDVAIYDYDRDFSL